jgi:hypothetical protein
MVEEDSLDETGITLSEQRAWSYSDSRCRGSESPRIDIAAFELCLQNTTEH